MNNPTSTLILLGEDARQTKEQDDRIQSIVRKSVEKNPNHRVIAIDALTPLVIRIMADESSKRRTLSKATWVSDVFNAIKEYMNKEDVTVLVFLDKDADGKDIKEIINARALMSWSNIHRLYKI
ncbi:MAG: hypothetical protein QG654_535 [Patescibacteria group bacterium]|nr:hypothetical protein [Patescibacteria group bacterium]